MACLLRDLPLETTCLQIQWLQLAGGIDGEEGDPRLPLVPTYQEWVDPPSTPRGVDRSVLPPELLSSQCLEQPKSGGHPSQMLRS